MSARGAVLLRLARETLAEAFGGPPLVVPDEAWLPGTRVERFTSEVWAE